MKNLPPGSMVEFSKGAQEAIDRRVAREQRAAAPLRKRAEQAEQAAMKKLRAPKRQGKKTIRVGSRQPRQIGCWQRR